MLNIGAPLLSRISTLLAIKVLPDEAALHVYLRNAFKGVAMLITGSVVLGAAISASLYVIYDQLITVGYSKSSVLAITLGTAFFIVAICFYAANKWLSQRFAPKLAPKNIIDEKLDYIKDIATDTVTGFVEGLLEGNSPKKRRKDNTVDFRSARNKR